MRPESLAEFELLVMLAALRLGAEEAYTVSIAEDIQRKTGRSVRRANVYTTLQRLEAKGLVSTHLGAPRPERGGKPRRLVALEPGGIAAVRSTTAAIRAMAAKLDDAIGGTG
ncbi:MAG: helix-turn-helix transcriptional regulator [Longimicrobiales bacterium]